MESGKSETFSKGSRVEVSSDEDGFKGAWDGWWTVVITRISEDSKCTVFFQNPPDEIQFDRSDLRVHKEWVDGKWVRPEKQRTTGLIFSPGAAVEVTLNDQHDA